MCVVQIGVYRCHNYISLKKIPLSECTLPETWHVHTIIRMQATWNLTCPYHYQNARYLKFDLTLHWLVNTIIKNARYLKPKLILYWLVNTIIKDEHLNHDLTLQWIVRYYLGCKLPETWHWPYRWVSNKHYHNFF